MKCAKCGHEAPGLAKVTCPGCGEEGCARCLGPQREVTAGSKCKVCVRELPLFKRELGPA